MLYKVVYVIFGSLLAVGLTACVVNPQLRQPLPPDVRSAANSTRVISILARDAIQVGHDQSIPSVPIVLGVLSGPTAAAESMSRTVESRRQQSESDAKSLASKMASLELRDIHSKWMESVFSRLEWPHTQEVIHLSHDVPVNRLRQLIGDDVDGGWTTYTTYTLTPDLAVFAVQAVIKYWPRGAKRPAYTGYVEFQSLPIEISDSVDALRAWADSEGRRVKEALEASVSELSELFAYELSELRAGTVEAGSGKVTLPYSTGDRAARIQLTGTLVRETKTAFWVRSDNGVLVAIQKR